MSNNNWLIEGTIASGKSRKAKILACKKTGLIQDENQYDENIFINNCNKHENDNKQIIYIPIREGYEYSEFMKGIDVCANDKLSYSYVDKVFIKACKKAQNTTAKIAVILDDIDKTDSASLFGELLYAIENRGNKVLLNGGGDLTVPDNLIIIITSSTVFAKYKIDYAILRRFNIIHLNSDRNVLSELVNLNKIDEKAIEYYDFYNAIIEKRIYDKDKLNDYIIGHGWFIEKSKEKLLLKICYQIIPLILEYQKAGVLVIPNEEIEIYKADAYHEISTLDAERTIKRIECKVARKGLTREEDRKSFDEIRNELISSHLSAPAFLRYIFELTYKSGLIDADQLMAHIYLNTDILSVKNKCNDLVGGYLIQENDSQYGFIYNDNDSHQGNPSQYYSKGRSSNNYPVYSYSDLDYMLFSGVRSTGTLVELRKKKIVDSAAAEYRVAVLAPLVYNYYKLYLENLLQLKSKNGSGDPNLNNLIEIVKEDMKWLESKDNKRDDNFHKEILNKNNLAVFNAKKGDTVTKQAGKKMITAVLKGVKGMASKDFKWVMDTMNIRQMILQGPPGTSKTYGAKRFITMQIDSSKDDLDERTLNRCHITDEWYDCAENGETDKIPKRKAYWDIVQFHPSYGYEDFVRGITVEPKDTGVSYRTVNKVLGRIAQFSMAVKKIYNNNVPVFLVIDEINRANVSTTFGELIYALEYRNVAVTTPYKVVNKQNPVGESSITLPDNLYIIGTMNTADKSIGSIDYAVRRRFVFFSSLPDKKVVDDFEKKHGTKYNLFLFEKVEEIFSKYLSSDYYKDDVQVGHTMFLAESDAEMRLKFEYQVLPILREYYKDGILLHDIPGQEKNILMKYLINYGTKDFVSEEDLWIDIIKEKK